MAGKKRVIRIHRALSLSVAVLLTVVIAVAVFQKSGLLSYQLSKYVNSHYLADTPFRFSCGRISGDMVGHVRVARPSLRYDGPEGVFEVFRADHITLDYNLLQVLKLKMLISNLALDDVRVSIREDADGNLLLPIPAAAASLEGPSVLSPHIEVKAFSIDDMRFSYSFGDSTVTVRDAAVEGVFQMVRGELKLRIDEATAFLVENDMPIQSLELKARSNRDGIWLDDLQLRLDRSFVMGSGRLKDGRLHRVQGIFNPLVLDEISALGLIPPESGELGGSVIVDGVPDSLTVKGSVTGQAVGLAFSGLTFEGIVTPSVAHLTDLQGTFFGSRVNGDFRYQRGEGSYEFQGVCEGLDVSHGFIKDEGVPKTDLNGLINLQYIASRDAYEVRADLRHSVVDGFESHALQGRLGYRKTTGLRFRSIEASRDGFVLRGSGLITPEGTVEMLLDLEGDDPGYILDYFELPPVEGAVSLSGRLVGPMDRLQLNLNGSVRDLAYLFGTIDSSTVHAEAKNIGSDDVTAVIDVEGKRLQIKGRRFSDPHLLLEVTQDDIIVKDFTFAQGDTVITSDFEVDIDEGTEETTVLFKHLVVKMPHSVWWTPRPVTLWFTPTSARIDSLVLQSNGHQLGVIGTYSMDDRSCDIRAWGSDLDLSLIREAFGLPVRLEGNAEFTASARGEIDNPTMSLSARARRGAVDSLSFDGLQIDAAFDGRRYRLDRLHIVEDGDSLAASGSWDYGDSPVRIVREGFARDAAKHAAVFVVAKAAGYPLASVFRATRQRVHWAADFDGDFTMDNTLANPRIVLKGEFLSGEQTRYHLPPVTADVIYRNGMLSIQSLSFDDGSTTASVTGSLPVLVGFDYGVRPRREVPVNLSGFVASTDLSAAADYFDEIAMLSGKVSGQLELSGTMDRPDFRGVMDFKECGLRLTGMQEVYNDVSARFELENDMLKLVSISGGDSKKGRITGSGRARLAGFRLASYEADVDLKEFTLTSIPDVVSTQDGVLHIVSQRNPDGSIIPDVRGAVRVKQTIITQVLAEQHGPPTPLTMPTESPTWLCDIDVNAPKNVWLKNPDLNMELGGNTTIHRDQQGLYFRGDLSVLRGSYTLYGNKFRITGGTIDFSATTLRPGVLIDAYTPHRGSGGEENRIFLNFSWPWDEKEPTITLSYSAPGYSEQDLWKMLGGQVVAGDAGLSSGSDFNAGGAAQNIASSYLERILNAQMQDMTIDVETRSVGGSSAEREMSIAVGRYLSEDLYLKYRQGLNFKSALEVDIEYRISNLLLLRSEIIRHAQTGITNKSRTSTEEINFDLKFRWEY